MLKFVHALNPPKVRFYVRSHFLLFLPDGALTFFTPKSF
jgi:hypothetical protein